MRAKYKLTSTREVETTYTLPTGGAVTLSSGDSKTVWITDSAHLEAIENTPGLEATKIADAAQVAAAKSATEEMAADLGMEPSELAERAARGSRDSKRRSKK